MANYEEFMDPNSAIARIIMQMQNAATRSNPDVISQGQLQGDLQPGGAQPGPVGAGPGMETQMGPELRSDMDQFNGTVRPPIPEDMSAQAYVEQLLRGMNIQ
jgi:hypothetical protein